MPGFFADDSFLTSENNEETGGATKAVGSCALGEFSAVTPAALAGASTSAWRAWKVLGPTFISDTADLALSIDPCRCDVERSLDFFFPGRRENNVPVSVT